MMKAKNARRWFVAAAVAVAGFGLTGCEANPTDPGEGSQADNLRDGIKGYDSEPNTDCEVWFCYEPSSE